MSHLLTALDEVKIIFVLSASSSQETNCGVSYFIVTELFLKVSMSGSCGIEVKCSSHHLYWGSKVVLLSIPCSPPVWERRNPAGLSGVIWSRWIFHLLTVCGPTPVIVSENHLPWIISCFLVLWNYLAEFISRLGLILMIFKQNSSCFMHCFSHLNVRLAVLCWQP